MNRLFGGRLQRLVDQSWQMYPLGVLFGLGLRYGRYEERYGHLHPLHSHPHVHDGGVRHALQHFH